MKEHPIIFSTNMMIAILEGRKTMTRRVMREHLPIGTRWHQVYDGELLYRIVDQKRVNTLCKCPYGSVGDMLWVRECFRIADGGSLYFKADEDWSSCPDWKPSIHMPRWASRITLKITDIRVERVQEITPADVIAEGIIEEEGDGLALRDKFEKLWDSINAARGFGWKENLWVWVIAFRRVDGSATT